MNPISAERIFSIGNDRAFHDLALEIFRFQAGGNPVYRKYLDLLGVSPGSVTHLEEIPFLPVEFFRDHRVVTGEDEPEFVFESSGTTGTRTSLHYVTDGKFYLESLSRGFELFYGEPSDYCILALLPSYLERSNSSLVYMAAELIRKSRHPDSGFYLDQTGELLRKLEKIESSGQRAILLGVSFALADLAERAPMHLKSTLVMETGGMKGRRKELTREELHALLKKGFGVDSVHSEYGMTELLSQAWSHSRGIFHSPAWMKVLIRDPYDPLSILEGNASGGLNIIDLANLNSCSFIATQDIGRKNEDGGFEVLGRFDHSDIRGCNLMVE
jgi:phenylacetate-coenzyme A ligase PaaK-like adenylate-forming protein